MSPELRARITARNETAAGFAEVKRDAVATANAVEASGARAAAGLARQNTALVAMGQSNRMAAQTSRMLAFQLNDIAVSLASGMNPAMVAVQQGSQIAQLGLANVGRAAAGMITKFAPIAVVVGAGAAALSGLQREINKTSDVQVSFGDTALAVWQVFSEGVYDFVAPAITAIGSWIGEMWDMAQPVIVGAGNAIIGTFLGAFDATKIAWSALPNVMGDVAFSAANFVLDGVEAMVNGSIGLINDLKRAAGLEVGDIGKVDFNVDNPFKGAAAGLGEDVAGALSGALSNDYLGGLFETISGRAQGNALNRLAEDAEKASGALKAANDNIDPFKSRISELADVLTLTQDPFQQMMTDLTDIRTLYEHGRISAEQFGQATFKTMANTASSTLGVVGQLTGAMSQLFKDNKAFAVANAVINTAEGVTKALAQGGIFGFVGAAAVAASGAAQIAAILSASPGSSSAPTVGPAPVAANQIAPVAERSVTVNLQGDVFGRHQVESLLDMLQEEAGDRGIRIVTQRV